MTDAQKWKSGVWVVAVLLVLFVAYVASIGPVVSLVKTGQISRSCVPALEAFYYPLGFFGVNVPVIGRAVRSYVELRKL